MRVLKFIVDGQTMMQDPACDFSGLVPGSDGYLQAEFVLSPDWNGRSVIAAFYSALGKEYMPQIVNEYGVCKIPKEALAKRTFKVELWGGSKGHTVKTNRVAVHQNGGTV